MTHACGRTAPHAAHDWRGFAPANDEPPMHCPGSSTPHVHVWDYAADPAGTCACGEPPQRITPRPDRRTFRVRAGDCRFTLEKLSAAHLFPGPHTVCEEGAIRVSRLNDGNLFIHNGRHRVIRALILTGPDTELDAESEYDDDDTEPPAAAPCCDSHHFEGCADGEPGCCPRCPINPWLPAARQATP